MGMRYAMLIIKYWKRESAERKELSNQKSIKILGEEEKYKYLGILEADTIKQAEMKETIRKYLWRTRKLLEIKNNKKNSRDLKRFTVTQTPRNVKQYVKNLQKNNI